VRTLVPFSRGPEDSDESQRVITTSPRDAFSSTYTRCQRNDIITRRHVAIGMPRQAIAPVYPLWRRAGRFAVISLDMEKFAAPGTIACVAARMFLLLLLLFQKKKKKKKKEEEKKKKKKRKGENEKRPEISAEYLCVLKSFLLLTRTRILNGALPRESSHVSSPITETRHCARAHTRARTHARTHALYRSKSNRASERSRDRDTGLRLSCDLAIYSSEQREPRHADCTRVLFTRMNEATRAQP